MKVCLFTSNQPRHIALIRKLEKVCKELFVVQEVKPMINRAKTQQTEVFETYFSKMFNAEKEIFGTHRFLSGASHIMPLALGESSKLPRGTLSDIFDADLFIVFGCGILNGELGDFLIQRNAINLHLGISPFFRGSACNFWAQNSGFPELVGATIHFLSKDVDSGRIITRVVPRDAGKDGFLNGMLAVEAGQNTLIDLIKNDNKFTMKTIQQDETEVILTSKKKDFCEAVVRNFLDKKLWRCTDIEERRKSFLNKYQDVITAA